VLFHPVIGLCIDREQKQNFAEPETDITGARMNTISWQFVCSNFFDSSGHEETCI
jgi:hypothetical protein